MLQVVIIILMLFSAVLIFFDFTFIKDEKSNKNSLSEDISKESIIEGIKNNEFYVMYQPQINADENKLHGVEALIRWNHPKQGLIPVHKFISVAEETKAILEIGKFVLEDACKNLSKWTKNGCKINHLSINITAIELMEKETITYIEKMIEKYEINPSQLMFEITETNSAQKYSQVKENLDALSKLGVIIAIDDFGKEYSALSYLADLPIQIIKIDKFFVDNVTKDSRIMKMIIDLASTMGFGVIAEGVENKQQLERVCEMGCNVIQGYYFEKPIMAEEIEEKYFGK